MHGRWLYVKQSINLAGLSLAFERLSMPCMIVICHNCIVVITMHCVLQNIIHVNDIKYKGAGPFQSSIIILGWLKCVLYLCS